MEQIDSIPFSSLIAGMLLGQRNLSATDIAKMESRLSYEGICVDDEDDDISCLYDCIDFGKCCSISLKKDLDYQTVLFNQLTVAQFLRMKAGDRVLSYFEKIGWCLPVHYGYCQQEDESFNDKQYSFMRNQTTLFPAFKKVRKKVSILHSILF